MDEGTNLEYRIFRLFFHNRYFTRRSIPLRNYYYPDYIDVTDIDVYGIRYNIDFSTTFIMADCKSNLSTRSSDAKPANRILWISGLKKFLKCDVAYFCKPHINGVMKDFALKNGVIPIDYIKLAELEKKFAIKDVWEGSYNISNHHKLISYYNDVKSIKDLNSLYWFLRVEFWTLPSNLQIKKCINYIEDCFKDPVILDDYKKFLLVELYILSAIALLNLCRDTFPYTQAERGLCIANKMVEGIGTIEQQEKILSLVRAYTQMKIKEITQQEVPVAPDAFIIPPPDYTEDLIQLIERLIERAECTIEIPRFLDYFLYEYILSDKDVNVEMLKKLFKTDIDMIAKLSKNLIKLIDPIAGKRKMNTKLFNY